MKKLLALMLAAALALSLAACVGDSRAGDTNTPSGGDGDTTSADTPSGGGEEQGNDNANTQYAIGDTFGTDTIECVITAADLIEEEDLWVPELVSNGAGELVAEGEPRRETNAGYFYPGYQFYGISGFPWKPIDNPYLCVTFTLHNIGKEEISPELITPAYGDVDFAPYGNIAVLYDDGYVFESEQGFTTTLEILSDKVLEGRIIEVPKEVSENTDKPLMLRITLPNSTGETEKFIITIR